ncbi:MAG: peptidylprolyl isomerase [Bdellovibrionales bacterium]
MTLNIHAKEHLNEKGNATVIVLVALVVVAVGALAYFSGHLASTDRKNAGNTAENSTIETASGEEAADNQGADADSTQAENAAPQQEIKPGNPVVAKVGDKELTRLEVFNFMQTMPAESRQLPMDQLFPLVQNQIINMALVKEKAVNVNLDNDPLVKERLEAAKQNIVPVVFMQREVEKAINEERLKSAYDQYVAQFPEVEEAKAAHILVDDEALAKDLIAQLKEGVDFAELAKANSKDSTSTEGGNLGYFLKTDVVAEFGEAAFAQEVGAVSDMPVKSEFGFHIIKVDERRQRPPVPYEEAKPFLEGQLRNIVTNEIVTKWREEAGVELFDINGESVEPAAGEEAKPAE